MIRRDMLKTIGVATLTLLGGPIGKLAKANPIVPSRDLEFMFDVPGDDCISYISEAINAAIGNVNLTEFMGKATGTVFFDGFDIERYSDNEFQNEWMTNYYISSKIIFHFIYRKLGWATPLKPLGPDKIDFNWIGLVSGG